jgi:hypothetical protein
LRRGGDGEGGEAEQGSMHRRLSSRQSSAIANSHRASLRVKGGNCDEESVWPSSE